MRVLIDYRPALRERSGVGEYTHRLAAALLAAYPPDRARSPLEVTIFASSWKDRLIASADLRGAAMVDRRIPVHLLNLLWHRAEMPPIEWLARGGFDVAHSLHPLLLPARRAAQVITIHDLNFLTHPERTRAEIRRDYPALSRDHAHRADAIIVPSHFTATEVSRRLDVALERMTVCSPGAPDWTPSMPAADGYVLFFGTLEPRKNVGGLLDAYERLPRPVPELVLAGKATDEARAWLERIARPPLRGVVRHIGYVDPADRRRLYAGARLLVQPSFEEGFGIPVLEAMAAGVPVVASNRGALPELLGDAGSVVDPEQPDQMAAAIGRVLSDRGYADACRMRGLSRAREFSWARTAERVYGAYQQAIERSAARRRAA